MLVVAGSGLLPWRGGGGHAAAATLRGLAVTAEQQPAQTPPPGSYTYGWSRASLVEQGGELTPDATWWFRTSATRELWLAADGSGRIVTTYGASSPLTPADREAWRAAGSPALHPQAPETYDFGAEESPVPDLAALPTDRDELARVIEARGIVDAPAGDLGTFDVIGELLSLPGAPPELRAALFEVAAALPGVEDRGVVDDPLGRTGRALTLRDDAGSTTLVFDLGSSELLAALHDRAIGAATETSWDAYDPDVVVNGLRRPA